MQLTGTSHPTPARRGAVAVAVAAVLTVSISQPLMAQDKKELNKATEVEKKHEDAGAADQAALAAQLALQGEKHKSPILLLAAAELLGGLKESAKDTDGVKSEKTKAEGKAVPSLSFPELLDKATEIARGDEKLAALVAARVAELRSGKGLVLHQGRTLPTRTIYGETYKIIDSGVIRAKATNRLKNVIFEGGRPARIIVVGDGDGDLDLWVYDGGSGRLADSDTDLSSRCVAIWSPRWEGPFTIKISNVGRVAERYYVLANW